MKQLNIKRGKLGLSQMRLAQLSGVSRFKIFKVENDYAEFTRVETQKIRRALFNRKGKPIKVKNTQLVTN